MRDEHGEKSGKVLDSFMFIVWPIVWLISRTLPKDKRPKR